MSDTEIEKLFQQGVAAIRAGDKATARELLTQVVDKQQFHEQAWLWLSAAVTDKAEQIVCLENVLTINPDNEIAQRGLRKLGGTVPEKAVEAPPPAPEPVPEPAPAKEPDDKWRARLKDTDYVSEATIVKPMHEHPKLGIFDLANAWVWAMIFRVEGPYQEFVDDGPFWHVLISILVAAFFETIGAGALLGFLSADPKILANLAYQNRNSTGLKLSGPGTPSLTSLFATNVAATTVITVGIGFCGALILATFVGILFQSFVMNLVSGWLGGKGSVIPMAQALGVALVPTSLVLVIAVILLILNFGPIGLVVMGAAILYQFIQTSNAVNASQRLGIFASMGVVLLSGFLMNVIGGCFSFAMSAALGGGR